MAGAEARRRGAHYDLSQVEPRQFHALAALRPLEVAAVADLQAGLRAVLGKSRDQGVLSFRSSAVVFRFQPSEHTDGADARRPAGVPRGTEAPGLAADARKSVLAPFSLAAPGTERGAFHAH